MADVFLYDIRCATCKRHLGVGIAQKWGIYCDEFCAADLQAYDHEARDSFIEALRRDTRIPVMKLAEVFGMSRQRVYDLLSTRDVRNSA